MPALSYLIALDQQLRWSVVLQQCSLTGQVKNHGTFIKLRPIFSDANGFLFLFIVKSKMNMKVLVSRFKVNLAFIGLHNNSLVPDALLESH